MPLRKGQLALKKNPNWKGGRSLASNGYVLVKSPEHPLADSRGYVYEHRLIAQRTIGRPLKRGEQVHHLNGDKTDNRPENIVVTSGRRAHAAHHRKAASILRLPGEPNVLVRCACGCGAIFYLFDPEGRPRRYRSGHN